MTTAMLGTSLFLGLLGILGMTWLFPILGRMTALLGAQRKFVNSSKPTHSLRKVAILVPAHNEETALTRSLASMQRAIAAARAAFPNVDFVLRVGADGCKDASADVARAAGAEVIEYFPNQGKWNTLVELTRASADADWVVFGDAGIGWPEELLVQCLELSADPRVMAVAPTYRNPEAGPIEQALWAFERHLKSLESSAGGPVSIHGATVMYRRRELAVAFQQLQGRSWLNDDVVLPMYLRLLFPTQQIRYFTALGVYDSADSGDGPKARPREFGRRRRMVMGNIQWMRAVLPQLRGGNLTPGLLALRRVFRLFWAYWLLLLGLTALAIAYRALGPEVTLTAAASLAVLPLISRKLRGPVFSLMDSAFASLLAPFYFFSGGSLERTGWK